MKRTTQHEIALECGVSVMTVSRALRNDRSVAKKTKERIRKAAARLGYCPDPILSALIAHRLGRRPSKDFTLIPFIISYPRGLDWRENHVVLEAFLGAQARASEIGYSVEVFNALQYAEKGLKLSKILANRGARSLLLAPLPLPDTELDFEWDDFSVLAIGYSIRKPAFTFVAHHHSQSIQLSFSKLRAYGYRRPTLVMNQWSDMRTYNQMMGAWFCEQEHFSPNDRIPIFLHKGRPDPETVRAWIDHHKPDVLLDNYPVKESILLNTGLEPSSDIGYINLNVSQTDTTTAGIYQNFLEIGRAAVDQLNVMMQRGETGIPKLRSGLTFFGEWREGETIRTQRS